MGCCGYTLSMMLSDGGARIMPTRVSVELQSYIRYSVSMTVRCVIHVHVVATCRCTTGMSSGAREVSNNRRDVEGYINA